MRIKSKPEHALILGTILAIAVTGFGAEVWRIALQGRPDFEQWSFVSYPIAGLIDGSDNLSGVHQAWWIAHVGSFFLFLVILPVPMLRPIFKIARTACTKRVCQYVYVAEVAITFNTKK